MQTSRHRSRTAAITALTTLALALTLTACSGATATKAAEGVEFRPAIAESDSLSARNAFESAIEPIADVEAALASAERTVAKTIETAYPEIAADQPGLAKEFLDTECPWDPETKKFPTADPHKAIVACDPYYMRKYILGPSEVSGSDITLIEAHAAAAPKAWEVSLELNEAGTKAMETLSARLSKLPTAESRAIDTESDTGELSQLSWTGSSALQQGALTRGTIVISAPVMQATITDGKLSISGNFDEKGAKDIAALLTH